MLFGWTRSVRPLRVPPTGALKQQRQCQIDIRHLGKPREQRQGAPCFCPCLLHSGTWFVPPAQFHGLAGGKKDGQSWGCIERKAQKERFLVKITATG